MYSKAVIQKAWIESPKGIEYLNSENFKNSQFKYNRTTRRIRDKKYRELTSRKIRKIKIENGCKICGFNAHHTALQFHHRNPDSKKFRIGDCRNYSWNKILIEIEKCDILCGNCHAILEFNKRVEQGISEV